MATNIEMILVFLSGPVLLICLFFFKKRLNRKFWPIFGIVLACYVLVLVFPFFVGPLQHKSTTAVDALTQSIEVSLEDEHVGYQKMEKLRFSVQQMEDLELKFKACGFCGEMRPEVEQYEEELMSQFNDNILIPRKVWDEYVELLVRVNLILRNSADESLANALGQAFSRPKEILTNKIEKLNSEDKKVICDRLRLVLPDEPISSDDPKIQRLNYACGSERLGN